MSATINDNKMKASFFQISATGIIGETLAVRDVRISYLKDTDGKRTDSIDVIRYDCIDPDNFSSFTIKVSGAKPVVTKEELENADNPLYISVPLDKVEIKPYAIEFGFAKVSITAPYVKLAD